jgi:hypothetical protein
MKKISEGLAAGSLGTRTGMLMLLLKEVGDVCYLMIQSLGRLDLIWYCLWLEGEGEAELHGFKSMDC